MAKAGDIIEIVEFEYYHPRYDIGTHYVVITMIDKGELESMDVPIINTKGEYDIVSWEEYKVVGNIVDKRQEFLDSLPKVKPYSEGSAEEFFNNLFNNTEKPK